MIKFLLGVIVLSIINGKMGYMTKLDNMAIVLIVSLLCSFLPTGFMAFFAMMFAVLHMYALSIETAAVGLVVFLLLYLLFLRFTAKEALVVVLTPVLLYAEAALCDACGNGTDRNPGVPAYL